MNKMNASFDYISYVFELDFCRFLPLWRQFQQGKTQLPINKNWFLFLNLSLQPINAISWLKSSAFDGSPDQIWFFCLACKPSNWGSPDYLSNTAFRQGLSFCDISQIGGKGESNTNETKAEW